MELSSDNDSSFATATNSREISMSNLKDFSDEYGGLRFIARRHFEYRSPMPVTKLTAGGSNASDVGAMIYARYLDPAKLGLDAAGSKGAMMHGEKLAEMGIIPDVIFHGRDQRNFDGAWLTSEEIARITKTKVPCQETPAVTYPVYPDTTATTEALNLYGDLAVHRTLAGKQFLFSEDAETFRDRIVGSLEKSRFGLVLWDLNFEAIVLLYYHYVRKVALAEIPCDATAWLPQKGGGIVRANDGAVAVFNRDMEITEIA